MSYLESGFNQNLTRQPEETRQYDSVNISDLLPSDSTIPLSNVSVQENNIKEFMVESLSVAKLEAGTIEVAMNVGGSNVLIDGGNTRIVINDGSNDRILLGYLSGKF